jgi:hypothetical protein
MKRSPLASLAAVLAIACAAFGVGCVGQTEPADGDTDPATESPKVETEYDKWDCFKDCQQVPGESKFCACACGFGCEV